MYKYDIMRKINYIILIIVFIMLFCRCSKNNAIENNIISEKICETIDKQSIINEDSVCSISMNEVTDFEWDKKAVFGVGSSNKEISEFLGDNTMNL